MTDYDIDETTGLPELPEGQHWRVGEFAEAGNDHLRVSAVKTRPCSYGFRYMTDREFDTAEEALRDRQQMYWGSFDSRHLFGGEFQGTFSGIPDMFRDDIEIVDAHCETKEVTRRRRFRKPEVVRVEYTWTGKVHWDHLETVFETTSANPSKAGIRIAAIRALREHLKDAERRAFIESVVGCYPPNKLEVA